MFSHTGAGGFRCQGGTGLRARRISKGIAAGDLLKHRGKRPAACAIASARGKDRDACARTPEIHRTLGAWRNYGRDAETQRLLSRRQSRR